MNLPRLASFGDHWLFPPYRWQRALPLLERILGFRWEELVASHDDRGSQMDALCVVALRGNLESYERGLFASHSVREEKSTS